VPCGHHGITGVAVVPRRRRDGVIAEEEEGGTD